MSIKIRTNTKCIKLPRINHTKDFNLAKSINITSKGYDVIKQNESELANIDCKIEPIIALNFLCILLF